MRTEPALAPPQPQDPTENSQLSGRVSRVPEPLPEDLRGGHQVRRGN